MTNQKDNMNDGTADSNHSQHLVYDLQSKLFASQCRVTILENILWQVISVPNHTPYTSNGQSVIAFHLASDYVDDIRAILNESNS